MRVTAKLNGCDDRSCEAVWATDDSEIVAVQGTRLSGAARAGAGVIPDHEDLVLVKASLTCGK